MANKWFTPLRAWLCAGLAGLAGLVSAPAVDARVPSARLSFKLPKNTTLGEPVLFTANLHNTSGGRIVADFGAEDESWFVFLHTKPDGSSVRAQPSTTAPRGQRTRHLILRGNTYTAVIVLDRFLDFSAVGRHRLDVEFRGPVTLENATDLALGRTATLRIEVKPRDAKRLGKRSAEWLKQVSTLSTGQQTRAAAKALVVMTDPVAIPYLELAVQRTRDATFATALAAHADPQARAALARLAQSPDPDVRALAERAIASRR
jgi:hypothetical protein